MTIPVVEEDISVGKHEVERGHVRIYSRVTEQPAEASVRLREEKVTVERRPVDRPATDADFAAAEKEVIEMTETVEEPVVSKRARVVEEVVVHKDVTERTETVRGTVRHTEVEVKREPENAMGARRATAPQDFAAYDPIFRKHCATMFAGRGATYNDYEPAYRYGYELRTNERYRGRLDRPGSRRPPRLGSASPQYLGALQRRHPLWLGHSPRKDLGLSEDRAGESAPFWGALSEKAAGTSGKGPRHHGVRTMRRGAVQPSRWLL